MVAPWFSSIAQGRAIAAFLRMYDATGEDEWLAAARRAFQSFLNYREDWRPWTVFVDDRNYLWLEEYPKDPPLRVLNGHISTALALYYYARVTGDPEALRLFDGAATTVRHEVDAFRVPGSYSKYDLGTGLSAGPIYHQEHIQLLNSLAIATGDPFFADMAKKFREDGATAAG
jgi:hypothetical protein